MKTTRFLAFLAAVCAVYMEPPSAPAQALAADPSTGNLREDSLLNLAGPRITGILPPTHLGTGAPSSATVLRGDGAWVGTTATGNTIAATSNLLMGDGAGNAAGVASGADLHRVLKTRLESLQAVQAVPVNLLPVTNNGGTGLVSGTVNADGTMIVPANGAVTWTIYGDSAVRTLYGYVVAVSEQPTGALVMHANYGVDQASADSTILPGAYRSVFSSLPSASFYTFNIVVRNTTAAAIAIYYPVLSAQDTGLALLQSYADRVAVPAPPVADLDFTRFASDDRTLRYLAERQTTLAADSVNGSAGNAGTLYAPKLTLQQTVTSGSTFGLYRGSAFSESLPLSTLGNTHGIVVQDIALGAEKALPMVSALDPVPSDSFLDESDGTYSYLYTPTDSTIANDGYANVYAVEIDVALEAPAPVAARRRMVDVTSQAAAVATVGSAWLQAPGTGAGQSGSTTQWRVVLHPTSHAPAEKHYRYELVSRRAPANWGAPTNLGDGAMSGLELVGGSSGYGPLGSPLNFAGDRLALLHCTTHNAVLGGGSLQRSVFYESGDPIAIQLAWYASDPSGLSWDLRHCLFYANVGDRPANFLISHSSAPSSFLYGSGPNYERGDIADTAFIGARWSNGSLQGTAIDYINVKGGTINRIYV